MMNDLEIAGSVKLRDIMDVARDAGIPEDLVWLWGAYKAKIDISTGYFTRPRGKVVLVTAMSPTPAGEGKTTTAIGLAMALWKMGHRAIVGLREPSMGPVFGIKGGATGGGYSQVLPMVDINLHFTGDMHAITSAHNLLSAIINNSMAHGNVQCIDSRKILWPRVMDMNDRSLRSVVVGLGGEKGGMVDEDRFDITPASEVMGVLCLSRDLKDLKDRLSRMIVAISSDNKPIYAGDFGVVGAMTVLLKDAIMPNLVQTIEGTPAIIHGGPFANIAHGTSSYIAAMVGRTVGDIYVTEAGFGTDLGGEKFFDIFSRMTNTPVSAVVIVATVRAMKYHGGAKKSALTEENIPAMERGFENLRRHVENIRRFGYEPVVALNVTGSDTEREISRAMELCDSIGVKCARTEVYSRGSEGGMELASMVLRSMDEKYPRYVYDLDMSLKDKIEAVATEVYGAGKVVYSPRARRELRMYEDWGYGNLPVCIAKTQYSFSDNPKLRGAPEGFEFQINEVRINAGAGFIVPISGEITTMPGLPARPNAERIDIDEKGNITGLS